MGNVAWKPLEGSQSLAISCPCDEILFHGTRGGGKTEAQLAAFLKGVGIGYGAFYRGVIFDRGYKNLDDIVSKSLKIIPEIFPGAKFKASKSDLFWQFETGETLKFRHLQRLEQYRAYHGHEYNYIGFNELTSYPTPDLYDEIQSCNRSSFVPELHSPDLTNPLPPIPLVMFSTTNPHGAGHSWVKRRFIDPAPYGVPIIDERTVYNPRTQKDETIRRSKVAIFSSYRENSFLDTKYIASLDAITDPNKRAAWLNGDWSVTAGGALDDLFDPTVHLKERFPIPSGWEIVRSFDNGSSEPFAVIFAAIANGEEVTMPDGSTFCPRAGSIVLLDEIYGAELDTAGVPIYSSNKGQKLSVREVARQINEKEQELISTGWIKQRCASGVADNAIHNVNDAEFGCIADVMREEGIEWERSDKSAGSRINGLELMRTLLENATLGEGAGLYAMRNCRAFIECTVPIPRDENKPDDVNTKAIDHHYDSLRYLCAWKRKSYASAVDFGFMR